MRVYSVGADTPNFANRHWAVDVDVSASSPSFLFLFLLSFLTKIRQFLESLAIPLGLGDLLVFSLFCHLYIYNLAACVDIINCWFLSLNQSMRVYSYNICLCTSNLNYMSSAHAGKCLLILPWPNTSLFLSSVITRES